MAEINKIDFGPLNKYQWLIIISSSFSMFIYGLVLALPSISTTWNFVPSNDYVYIFLSIPVGTLIGNIIIGRFADLKGRKNMFILTLLLYGVGSLIVLLSNSFSFLIIGLFVSQIGLGGEMPTLLTYLSEMMPIKYREIVLIFTTNIANIGVLMGGILSLRLGLLSISQERFYYLISLIASIILMLIFRLMIPESLRWKIIETQGKKQIKVEKLWFKIYFLTSLIIATALTYALLALTIGPYIFPNLTSILLIVYNLGESIGGFISLYLVKKIGTRIFTLFSYLGGFITMIFAILDFMLFKSILYIFITLLFINGLFGEFAWAARVSLEPVIFPTGFRSTGIALSRLLPYFLYAASIFYAASFNAMQYLIYNLILWGIGGLASILWYIYGMETTNKKLEEINNELS
ncbi:arabinose efflux permease family protein [Caldisphaera lagunensis DSM 15908]|uniref:Arabinose efflux permease family protein n=1 Tax=Caldisphaera lagunensis (strain DSM 15908 / JCM 11604 / ANMR 0165 / IC-154) TaxID=1056495 RepID=L0ABZ1_CALLD|nr:MFS transporter [Caldisphaera lagunensis]AFZ70632.1 arabinose efflux permease family protein [Caldisphaera lagunensis DSM 15908]